MNQQMITKWIYLLDRSASAAALMRADILANPDWRWLPIRSSWMALSSLEILRDGVDTLDALDAELVLRLLLLLLRPLLLLPPGGWLDGSRWRDGSWLWWESREFCRETPRNWLWKSTATTLVICARWMRSTASPTSSPVDEASLSDEYDAKLSPSSDTSGLTGTCTSGTSCCI